MPLSVPEYLERFAQELGFHGHLAEEEYVLEPSGGIFEASDTLGIGHDWVQLERQKTPPLERFIIDPARGRQLGS